MTANAAKNFGVRGKSLFRNEVTGGWRLSLQVRRPKGKALELRAFLQKEKDALTETWSYNSTPE